ncbi:MAG: CPBP family intramembrane glutamic endopeptidase [Pyrinomonadaceae bacterium]
MQNLVRRFPVISFIFCCLFPVHFILWTAILMGASPESLKPLKLPFALLPSVSALFLTYIIENERGIVKLWQKTILRKTHFGIYFLAFFIFIVLGFSALVIRWYWDGYFPQYEQFPALWKVAVISPFLLLFPGFAEEYGWRGFMMEKLCKRFPSFLASILVGTTWGAWHGMDFLMGNWSSQVWMVCLFFVYIVGVSVIIGEIYVLSRGSVFIAMLAHFSANVVNFFSPVWRVEAGTKTPLIFISLIWISAVVLVFAGKRMSLRRNNAGTEKSKKAETVGS